MRITQIAKMLSGQDGAIWKDELFRFNHKGECRVYNLQDIQQGAITQLQQKTIFVLDRAEEIVPHSNSVV